MCTIPTTWNKIHAYLWNSKRKRERETGIETVWSMEVHKPFLTWAAHWTLPAKRKSLQVPRALHALRSHQTGKGGWASGPKAQGTKRNTSHFLAHVYPCLSKYFQVFSVWSEGPTFAGSACTAFWEMSTDCDKGKVQVYRSASNAWLWFVVTLQSKQMSCNNMQHASIIYMKIVGPSWAKLVKHVQHRTSVNHAGQVALMHLHAFTWNESAARPFPSFPAKGWRGFLLVESSGSMWQPKPNCARRPTTCWVAASQTVLHCFASSFAKRNMQNGASSSDAAMNFGKWDARPWRQA